MNYKFEKGGNKQRMEKRMENRMENRMDEFDTDTIDDDRESFAIQSCLIIRNLENMLEKTKAIEALLLQEVVNRVSETDFYQPLTTDSLEPPKKKLCR